MTSEKVRVKIKGFDHRLVDQVTRQIVEVVERTGAMVVGPVPKPTHLEKFCVIRSSNIDKDSREQFEIRTHKRLIDILQASSKTIDSLSQLNLASGVEIDIKL
jgi:small subunit ribosomal protein S10